VCSSDLDNMTRHSSLARVTGRLKCLLAAGLLCAAPQAAAAQPAPSQGQPMPPPSGQMPPGGQPMQHPGQGQMQHPTPPEQETQLQFQGKVSDVWSAEVDKQNKHEDKIVLVETDQGQVILADLGPSEGMDVKVEESRR